MPSAAPAPDPSRLGIGGNNPPPLRDQLAERYKPLAAGIEDLAASATGAPKTVKNDADLDGIGVVVRDAKQMGKRVEDARKREKAEFDEGAKTVQSFFKTLSERIERIAETLETRATDYQRAKVAEERRRREEAARKAEEDAARERAKAEAAREAGRVAAADKAESRAEAHEMKAADAAESAAARAADLSRSRGDSGTLATAQQSWTFEITNLDVIPLEKLRPYLARADLEKAIRSFVRVTKGGSQLEGVRIFEDVKARFR